MKALKIQMKVLNLKNCLTYNKKNFKPNLNKEVNLFSLLQKQEKII